MTRTSTQKPAKAPQDLSRPVRAFHFVVDATAAGVRIDQALKAQYPFYSRTRLQRKVREGGVEVNGRTAKSSLRVKKGDAVTVHLALEADAPEREDPSDLAVLFEDEHVVAIDKPSGMACHPVGRTRHHTLIGKLHARHEGEPGVVPRLGHRLDRDTSGIVLCVKTKEADRGITALFTARDVEKTYLALVAGVPAQCRGTIRVRMGSDPTAATRLHQCVRADGQPSESTYEVLEALGVASLVSLSPKTGRTHQLRLHMQHLGHPILADHLYGDPRPIWLSRYDPAAWGGQDRKLLGRLALHATRLSLPHPVTGVRLVIESPLPPDLQHARDALRTLGLTR